MKPKNYTYAGVGSRKTPPEILKKMTEIAMQLEDMGYTLYSGGADGADTAFERGVIKNKIIFLPWLGFNGRTGNVTIPLKAFEIARQFHPTFDNLSRGVRNLMARNSQQVLGPNCNTPVDFVLCWHNNSGGTMQTVRIAEYHGIPVFNMRDEGWYEEFQSFLEKEKQTRV